MSKHLVFFLLGGFLFTVGCKKDPLGLSDQPLSFSSDSLIFDTVFSTLGSITKRLTVYNTKTQDITIDKIYIPGMQNSNYSINVDGETGPLVENILLRKKDSLFVFVKTTIDPQNSNTPMVVEDSIVFVTQTEQKVTLYSWGQDAYYHTPNSRFVFLDQNGDSLFFNYHSIDCNTQWDNLKPHVIFGYAIVEPGCALNIQAGTFVHSYANSGIIVGHPFEITSNSSSIHIQGDLGNPVTFTHTRLDEFYKEDPGLWDRIWLTANSQDNSIEHAIIKNGNIGLQIDSNINSNPTAVIKHTHIDNHAGIGILAQGSRIEAENCIITDCGQHLLALAYGGDYQFTHCTMYNAWGFGSRTTPSVLINNYYESSEGQIISRDLQQATFINCIIDGHSSEELLLDNEASAQFNYLISHCALRTEEYSTTTDFFENNLYNLSSLSVDGEFSDPYFMDLENKDYHLNENSTVINKGTISTTTTDFDLQLRDGSPDIGAFEFMP